LISAFKGEFFGSGGVLLVSAVFDTLSCVSAFELALRISALRFLLDFASRLCRAVCLCLEGPRRFGWNLSVLSPTYLEFEFVRVCWSMHSSRGRLRNQGRFAPFV
jgi:hypothetical protein